MPGSDAKTAIERHKITGLVLAGGLGRRMSDDGLGLDKGLQPFRGKPMAVHVIERLKPQVGPLLINANRNQQQYEHFGAPVIADAIEGYAGPLAGLHAGMIRTTTPYLATVPCDSPFLPLDLVERLASELVSQEAQLAVAYSGAQAYPVFMLLDMQVRDSLEAFLATGRRKIDAWYAALQVATVDFEDDDAFRNINTPQELRQFE
jgi:molybdopterin-guanine dinucleotide biosynthesis protein A